MSAQACADRYNATRERILENIKESRVSASMSGIDYYPDEFSKISGRYPVESVEFEHFVKPRMTWDGEKHIYRPNWRQEYLNWVAAGKKEFGNEPA